MKKENRGFAVSVLTLAVQAALAAMAVGSSLAMAEGDEDVAALTKPTNSIEVGGIYTSKGSAKFGEYNGLDRSGGNLLGSFRIQGGDAFGQGSGTTTWSVYGNDLGTTSREAGASVGSQGNWNLGVSYDQLRHNISDTYQTPYDGTMGGNTFRLPNAFGTVNTGGNGARALTATQQATFHTVDVYSQRENTSFKAGYDFSPHWNVRFDFNRLNQTGSKLIGSGTDTSAGGWGAERIAILMTPTNYRTDTYNLALNWMGDKGFVTAEYFASLFHDEYNGLSWSNPFLNSQATGTAPPAGGFPVDTMGTAPSNQFHQLNLTGGYNFSSATHLNGGLSYARNTQNASYTGTYTPGTAPGLPVNSLDGLVETTHADAKLSHQVNKALNLSAGFKYNERDNKTASNTYQFVDLGGATETVVNIPMSNKRYQFELAGNYRITSNQRLNFGYEYDKIKRWCNNPQANNAQGATASYYTTASCVQIPENKEDKVFVTYRLKATEAIGLNAGYTYSDRRADVNSAFYNPMQANNQGYENFGYRAFFDASRKSNQFKLGANWQAAKQLELGLSGKLQSDDYDSDLGVQKGETSSVNLDASYAYSEKAMVSAFATFQHRTRDLRTGFDRNAVAPPVQIWTNKLKENDLTLGLSAKQKGLVFSKLELAEDLTYSLAKTDYSTAQEGVAFSNCSATTNLGCGALPTIKSAMTQFKLTGTYKLDKASKLVMGYMFQHLKSDDYFYNVYQYGYTATTMLPTNQQAPSYSVNSAFVAYNYSFQ